MKSALSSVSSFLVLLLCGCSALQGPPSSDLFDEHMALLAAAKGHALPAASTPVTPHADPGITQAMQHVREVCMAQNLVFDGSRGADGIVIVGRRLDGDSLLLGLKIYRTQHGSLAFTDMTYTAGPHLGEVAAMKARLMRAL